MSELDLTERNIEDFKKEPVWIEMHKTLTERRLGFLEDLAKAKIEDVSRIQGCISEIDYAMAQPDLILIDILEEEKDKETEPDSESGATSKTGV